MLWNAAPRIAARICRLHHRLALWFFRKSKPYRNSRLEFLRHLLLCLSLGFRKFLFLDWFAIACLLVLNAFSFAQLQFGVPGQDMAVFELLLLIVLGVVFLYLAMKCEVYEDEERRESCFKEGGAFALVYVGFLIASTVLHEFARITQVDSVRSLVVKNAIFFVTVWVFHLQFLKVHESWDAIRKEPKNAFDRLNEHTSKYVTELGILGTFFGLVIGLLVMSMAPVEDDALDSKVVIAVYQALLTTCSGLLFSIFYEYKHSKICDKACNRPYILESIEAMIANTTQANFQLVSLTRGLGRLEESVEKQRTSSDTFTSGSHAAVAGLRALGARSRATEGAMRRLESRADASGVRLDRFGQAVGGAEHALGILESSAGSAASRLDDLRSSADRAMHGLELVAQQAVSVRTGFVHLHGATGAAAGVLRSLEANLQEMVAHVAHNSRTFAENASQTSRLNARLEEMSARLEEMGVQAQQGGEAFAGAAAKARDAGEAVEIFGEQAMDSAETLENMSNELAGAPALVQQLQTDLAKLNEEVVNHATVQNLSCQMFMGAAGFSKDLGEKLQTMNSVLADFTLKVSGMADRTESAEDRISEFSGAVQTAGTLVWNVGEWSRSLADDLRDNIQALGDSTQQATDLGKSLQTIRSRFMKLGEWAASDGGALHSGMADLARQVEALSRPLGELDESIGTMGRTLSGFSAVAGDAKSRMNELDAKINKAGGLFEQVVEDLGKAASKTGEAAPQVSGSMQKLVTLTTEIQSSVVDVKRSLQTFLSNVAKPLQAESESAREITRLLREMPDVVDLIVRVLRKAREDKAKEDKGKKSSSKKPGSEET